MKTPKALKRLTMIEALMSDVVERYSTSAPSIRKALQDAMVAVTVAKEAVSLVTSSGSAVATTVKETEKAATFTTEPMTRKRSVNATATPLKLSSKESKPSKKKARKAR